ncbi:homing endonuclease associated repeat-containing protein [uncultured Clostridium sp.]|jgi:hypothetical protein|uniref:homing endonuclease associated repeat-containing protein n=1 Tax=uncultured Clostridium sp. TaxID=59620 RepID=UPI0025CDB8CF|nr:hypothetical protein [uncultured Clostridium sp.]
MDFKQCRYCKETKEIINFNKNIASKDGHQKYCKECNKTLARQYKERKSASEGRIMMPYTTKNFSTITDEELLQYIRDFNKEFKRPPTTADFEKSNNKYPHMKTYYRHFKYYKTENKISSWNDILLLAGVSPLKSKDLWSAWQYLVEKAASILEGECLFQYCGFGLDFKPDIYIPSKHKIIDAATSNYGHKHKIKQYYKSMAQGATVEYWCLKKNNKSGLKLPNLKYVFAEEIIERLSIIGEKEFCNQIKNLYSIYKDFNDTYKKHRQAYVIKKLQEFYEINGRSPYTRDFLGNPDYPSSTTVTTLFGTFNTALRKAKLPINSEPNIKFDEYVAITELLTLTYKLGRLPSSKELGPPNTTYTIKVYYKYWGGIEGCFNALGIDFTELKIHYINNSIIIKLNLFLKFKSLYNRWPLQSELNNKNNLPSYHWVHDHFKNLPNLIEHLENNFKIDND